MNRLRPRTTVLGGAAIGLVAGVAAFGFTSSTTVSSPVTKPASFTKSAPVGVAEPVAPVAASKAPCAKGQELEHGICIVHVERVVVRQRPALIQAQAQQSQSQFQSRSRSSDDSDDHSQARSTVQRSPRSQEDSSLSSSSGHEGEAPDHEDSDDHQDSNAHDSNAHEAGEHAAEGESED